MSKGDGAGEGRRIALVASKGTLDQACPPLILATTAVSMGWEAGIFFRPSVKKIGGRRGVRRPPPG